MKVRWRRGLSGATTSERFRLLETERRAHRYTVERECSERCSQHPLGLADCQDIAVVSSSIMWARKDGNLVVRILCLASPSMLNHEWFFRLTRGRPLQDRYKDLTKRP